MWLTCGSYTSAGVFDKARRAIKLAPYHASRINFSSRSVMLTNPGGLRIADWYLPSISRSAASNTAMRPLQASRKPRAIASTNRSLWSGEYALKCGNASSTIPWATSRIWCSSFPAPSHAVLGDAQHRAQPRSRRLGPLEDGRYIRFREPVAPRELGLAAFLPAPLRQ